MPEEKIDWTILNKIKDSKTLLNALIIGLWCSGYVGLLFYFTTDFFPKQYSFSFYVTNIGILIILIILSIQSILFYFKLILYIYEPTPNKLLSGALPFIYITLVIGTISFGYFTIIGVAVTFLFLKAGQLYFLTKKFGSKIKLYFKRMFYTYLLLSIISVSFGILADYYKSDFIHTETEFNNLTLLENHINNFNLSDDNKKIISEDISNIQKDFASFSTTNTTIRIIITYLFIIIFFFVIYKVALIKSTTTLEDLKRELANYYNNHPPGNNSGMNGHVFTKTMAMLTISRPFMSTIAGLISVSVYLYTTVEVTFSFVSYLFLTVVFTSTYGFTINDYFDLEKDKVQHKKRVLVRGLLSTKTALIYSIFVLLLSLLISFNISIFVFLLNLLTIFLLSIYSYVNNINGIWANIITAVNSSFVIFIGMLAGNFDLLIMGIAFAAFFLVFGREIILDLRDIKSDKIIGKISVPINFGLKPTFYFSSILFFIATTITFILSYYSHSFWFIVFLGILFNIMIWLPYFYLLKKQNETSLNVFFTSTRLAFLLILPALLL